MPKSNEFVDYLLELLEPFGQVTARAMFGGYGIYHNQLMFGLVADDMLYLKVDDVNRKEFEERKLQPFVYVKQGKAMKMSYYQIPEEALDNSDEMCRWAELAYSAALEVKVKPRKRNKIPYKGSRTPLSEKASERSAHEPHLPQGNDSPL